MRCVGTVVRGIRTPIIKQNDDLATIVVDSLIAAKESENFEFKDKDKFIDDIVDEVVDETVTEIFESKNTSQEQTEGTQYPNGLTPEIIDEWMNGAGDNK